MFMVIIALHEVILWGSSVWVSAWPIWSFKTISADVLCTQHYL